MADDQVIKPPDQASATGVGQPQPPGQILNSLQSLQGSPSREAMQQLQGPGLSGLMQGLMMPPGPAPANLGLAAGSGMLAGLAGRPTQNPYLQQHSEQQDADYRRQQDMLRMQERLQAQREKQNEAALTIADDMLKSDNPEAQQRGAQTKASLYKSIYGFDSKPEYWMRRADLSGAEQTRVDALLANGVSPADIAAMVPGLAKMSPDQRAAYLDAHSRSLKNPGVRRALGIESPEKLELQGITEVQDLKLAKDKAAAQERVDRGVGTARDLVILGAKGVDGLVDAAITQSIASGQPIPPEYLPYVRARQREQQLKGFTGKARLALEAAGGDYAKAWDLMQKDKAVKITEKEYRFGRALELSRLQVKESSGQPLTQKERIDKGALEIYLARGAGDTETVSRKAVTITDAIAPGLQASINELATRLPKDNSPTVDLHDGHPPVLKSKLLRSLWMRSHPNQDIEIQWTGKEWTPVRLWDINKTTKGRPARPGTVLNPTDTSAADDSDEED